MLFPKIGSQLLMVCDIAHALPMFRDDESKSLKRKREKERKDPVLSKQPELPVTGKGKAK